MNSLRKAPLALRLFVATRPAFLTITFFACGLGLACAYADDVRIDPITAGLSLIGALLAHAGVNVLNDYFDAASGADACNTERVWPFTGGSRMIQDGVLAAPAMLRLGSLLLALVVPIGLGLALQAGAGLLWLGLAGLLLGWAYSAPPLALMNRGLGEMAVAAGWLAIVAGCDFVQRGQFSWTALAAGVAYAGGVALLLYINEFPDWRADAEVGKRTLVVRLGRTLASRAYGVIAAAVYLWILFASLAGLLPRGCAVALAVIPIHMVAWTELMRNHEQPARLAPAIRLTIGAAHLIGVGLAIALVLAAGEH